MKTLIIILIGLQPFYLYFSWFLFGSLFTILSLFAVEILFLKDQGCVGCDPRANPLTNLRLTASCMQEPLDQRLMPH